MADELRDLRARISVETDAVLDAVCRSEGRDRSEIAREVLHAWALQKIAFADSLARRLEAEGISGSRDGFPESRNSHASAVPPTGQRGGR